MWLRLLALALLLHPAPALAGAKERIAALAPKGLVLVMDAEGNELNGYLRTQRKSDPKKTKYLTGELWRGFATVDPAWFDVASG